jgi:hypothetical protein
MSEKPIVTLFMLASVALPAEKMPASSTSPGNTY